MVFPLIAQPRASPAFGDLYIPLNYKTILAWPETVNGAWGQDFSPPPLPAHQRRPQVKPPPMASSITRSPRLMRPSATATDSASGIDAADVLPCLATVLTTFSGA